MNHLAHLYLSGENDELKIGNFIADSVKGRKFIQFPDMMQKGIVFHRAIDTYTDTHLIVRQSVHRLFPMFRHYSTVIVDILYDHFLAANWESYSDVPLEKYVDDFYRLLEKNYSLLPERVQGFLPYMVRDNWLYNYRSIEGIAKTLAQMDERTQYDSRMYLAVRELKSFYSEFGEEFKLFFADLERYCREERDKWL